MTQGTSFILLVEDEAAHAESICRAFQDAGENVEIRIVNSMNEYRKAIASAVPDIVLMDMNLPDGRAVDVLSHPPENGLFPIIVMTSYGNEDVAVEAMKAGALDYIVKSPASLSSMPGSVGRALREWKLLRERKRTEEALKESMSLFSTTFHSSPIPITISDPASEKWVEVNQAFLNVTGYTRTEVIGHTFRDINLWKRLEDREIMRKTFVTEGHLSNFEVDINKKNGSTGTMLISVEKVDLAGKPYLLIMGHEITERKRAEEALQKSEGTYRALIETTDTGFVIIDIVGRVLDANTKYIELTGHKDLADIRDHNVVEWTAGYAKEKNADAVKQCIRDGFIRNLEIDYVHKNGTVIPVEINATVVHTSDDIHILSICRDITERKRSEAELRKLSSAVEQSGSSVIITDIHGNIEYVNAKFIEVSGYQAVEAVGKNPRLLKTGHTKNEEYKELWEAITEGRVWRGEFHNKKKNGELYWESATISPIRNDSGTIIHFLAVKEDITEQKKMEAQLLQMQKLEGLGTLAGGIAHDFNNILGIILGHITRVTSIAQDSEKLEHTVTTITTAIERGKTLVQQILTFARKAESEPEPFNVNDVAREVLDMVFETFPRVITFSRNLRKDVPDIMADRSQFHQALLNLCLNAHDAMPEGGVLTMSTDIVSGLSLRPQFPDVPASDYVCIEVSDTGYGMAPEIRDRIFEPFFSTKEKGKGTGLGLAVVFGIVQFHHGFISVESEQAKGTTFKMYFPALHGSEPIPFLSQETIAQIAGGTETLLVVEDEEALMESLEMTLGDKGYTVIAAIDGETAIKIYKERQREIALVFTDLGLPRMTGVEELGFIKKINPRVNVIVATGYLDPGMKTKLANAGVHKFLNKPYNPIEVLKAVREVLDRK